ncbi:hypothetical protein PG637_02470 [Riemerella anatipestifer]|nr:hypothetical protein [Riemerella anatipestifer]MDY3324536.1 hypothetical protein [Riemerella anatipestifer]MDY3353346.1 hypothetical protein [Riemerella anatipestifer]
MKNSVRFQKAFEGICFELIIEAYHQALEKKEFQLNWNENDFSELLSFYVNENELSLKKGITSKTEQKLLKSTDQQSKGFADKLKRIDFVFFKIWRELRYEYFFEAKNLKQNDSALKRRYIDTGINSFVSAKYKNGSLIGYLLEGEVSETVKEINSLLIRDKRNAEILKLGSNNLLKSYFESNHSGIGTLKHLIFDFTTI